MPLYRRLSGRLMMILSALAIAAVSACNDTTPAVTAQAAAPSPVTATELARPSPTRVAPPSSATPVPPPISAAAFGMHYLDIAHPYPPLPFGTARVWDMGVTWADLQPAPGTWDQAALAKLDGIVATFR